MAVDRRMSGRAEQQSLFEDERRQPGYEHPPMSGRQLLPENWLKRSDVVTHSSWSPQHPMEGPHPTTATASGEHSDDWATTGVHYGSELAAADKREEGYFHAARIPHNAIADNPRNAEYDLDFNQSTANRDLVGRSKVWWDDDANRSGGQAQAALDAGKTIPYGNLYEDSGSISYRVPDAGKRTWEQDVARANRPELDRLIGDRNLIGRNIVRDAAAEGNGTDHVWGKDTGQRSLMGDLTQTVRPSLQPGQFKTDPDSGIGWKLRDASQLKDVTPALEHGYKPVEMTD